MIMCILHGEYHLPEADCAEALVEFWMQHQHLKSKDGRELYQLMVEQRMLANEVGVQKLRQIQGVIA